MDFLRLYQSLKLRIVTLAVLSGVLAAVGTATLVLDVTQAEVQRLLLANDRHDLERTAALLASKLETIKDSLMAVAQRTQPVLAGGQVMTAAHLQAQPSLGVLFDDVFAATPDGALVALIEHGALAHDLPNISDRSYFRRVMASDQPVISEPLRSKIDQGPIVVVAAPVLARGGTAVGVLAGTLSLRSNSLFTHPLGRRADGVRDLVMDRNGVILSHSDPARVLGHARDEPGLAEVFARWHESGGPIDTQATAQLSEDCLVSLAGIPFSDWALVRLTPQHTALAPMRSAQKAAWTTAFAAGLLAALVSGVLAFAAVQPITRLRDRAKRMLASGDAAISGWPEGEGEMEEMSRAFQDLIHQREAQRGATDDLLRQLRAVLDNADVGIALIRDERLHTVSRQLCSMLRCDPPQAVGQTTRLMFPSDGAYAEFIQKAQAGFARGGVFDGEIELARCDGELFWAQVRGRAIQRGDSETGTIWVITDATNAHFEREKLAWAATHDALTGLLNRAAFERLLEAAMLQAAELPFCALFIDLDRFKAVNDTGGHAVGDALLRGVGQEIAARLRRSETVARLGGDEFAVLLYQCPLPRAQAIAQMLRAAIESRTLVGDGQPYRVGASIGLVEVKGWHASGAEVMRDADMACYAAKRHGRNRVVTSASRETPLADLSEAC